MTALIAEIKTSVKTVGANGQISLGKSHAGRQVLVEEREPGVWLVRAAVVIPENEHWLHKPAHARDLQEALAWAVSTRAHASDPDKTFDGLTDGKRTPRQARPQQSRVSKKPARARQT
jgi:hypothetical protein